MNNVESRERQIEIRRMVDELLIEVTLASDTGIVNGVSGERWQNTLAHISEMIYDYTQEIPNVWQARRGLSQTDDLGASI